MNDFAKQILKRLLKDCKLCILTASLTLLSATTLSYLRLGRFLPLKAKGTDRTKQLNLYRTAIHQCFDVFDWHDKATLANQVKGLKHNVFHIDNVRVAVWIEDGNLHIVIRGSNNIGNWLANLNTDTDHKLINGSGVNVHRAYNDIAANIAAAVKSQYASVSTYPAYLRGGSLGGALAILVAAHLSDTFKIAQVVSVGGPKVGATRFNLPLTNIRHEQDPVPYLPIWNAVQGWDHDGSTILIKKDGTARWFENSFHTDLSLSLLYLEEGLDPSTHTAYREFVK